MNKEVEKLLSSLLNLSKLVPLEDELKTFKNDKTYQDINSLEELNNAVLDEIYYVLDNAE